MAPLPRVSQGFTFIHDDDSYDIRYNRVGDPDLTIVGPSINAAGSNMLEIFDVEDLPVEVQEDIATFTLDDTFRYNLMVMLEDTPIEEDIPSMLLLEELILRLYHNEPTHSLYTVDGITVTAASTPVVVYLPSTGSGVAATDFAQLAARISS